MADANVDITAGTGTSIDTRTEATNGNHRQVVVIGDPAANAGVAPVDAVRGVGVDLSAAGSLPIARAEDSASSSGDVGVPALAVRRATPANLSDTEGDYENLQMAGGRLWVSAAVDTALPAGTNSIGNLGVVTTLTGGGVAHDDADSGNPHKVGFKAQSTLPTAVANGDRVNGVADLFGRQMTGHIDPAMQVWKSVNYTTTQTGTIVWDPTSGKRIAITSIVIGSYGSTAARLILWFGAAGDTTYNAGTDQAVLAASFAPGTGARPGLVLTPPVPIFCVTADLELHITTDAAMSVDVTVYGYEW